MKIRKLLLPVLLTVAIICTLAACTQSTVTVTFYNDSKVYETVHVPKGAKLTLPEDRKSVV